MYFHYDYLHKCIDARKARSAWDKGAIAYAHDFIDDLEENAQYYNQPTNRAELKEILLNGAKDWSQYSWGGCSLCYDVDIVYRLATPSEIARWEKKPYNMANSREQWLDVQERALYQAFIIVCECLHM